MQSNFEKTLLQSQIEVQEATFSALGKELHDNVGQLLSSTKMLLGVTERSLTTPPDTLITAQETLARAINELRSLSRSLTKEWLEQFNLIENLQAEVARNNSANDLQIFLSTPQILSVSPDKQIILFRIIQEALQNAIKHASAKNIAITITEDNTAITTIIKDDGSGFDTNDDIKGMGLMNMKQRTQLLDGSITWQSNADEGTVINITLPVNEHPQ
jgi:signal transduction histidine kinase